MSPDQTFWDHISELRSRLLKSILGIFIGAALCYSFWERIWNAIAYPLTKQHLKVVLIATSPMETFMTSIKMSFVAGIVIASPWVMWQMWSFLQPAFFPKEKNIFVKAFFGSLIMFVLGAAFAYYTVLPAGIYFLANYMQGSITQNWKQGDFASFISQFLLAFGIIFELPVATYVLSTLGLVSPRGMWSFSRYAVVIIFIVAALLTPGPDPVSQLLMAIPLCLLYIISIGVCALTVKRTKVVA